MTTSAEQMAALARDLHSQPTPELTLDRAVEAAVEMVDACEAAGVSLTQRRGRISVSAATGSGPVRSVEIQQELGEGPCIATAAWDYSVIHVRDLTSEHRWPEWARRVHEETGIASIMCLQLFTHQDQLGVLSLYSSGPDAFDAGDEEIAFTVAAQAAVALAAAENIEQLDHALSTRTVIGQAVGVTMVRYDLTATEAFQFLRRTSSEQNRKIADIARELVEDWERDVRAKR